MPKYSSASEQVNDYHTSIPKRASLRLLNSNKCSSVKSSMNNASNIKGGNASTNIANGSNKGNINNSMISFNSHLPMAFASSTDDLMKQECLRQFVIIRDALIFQYCTLDSKMQEMNNPDYQNICVDDWFSYPDFENYHGPSNVCDAIKFVRLIDDLMEEEEVEEEEKKDKMEINAKTTLSSRKIIRILSDRQDPRRTNTGLLIGCYLMIRNGAVPDEAFYRMSQFSSTFASYRSEGTCVCTELIEIIHCLRSLRFFAIDSNLVDLSKINIHETIRMEQPLNGDMNWILPGKILALAGPTDQVYSIDQFLEYAKANGIKAIIRLNEAVYDRKLVLALGISHYDISFADGSVPSISQLDEFYRIVESTLNGHDGNNNQKGAIAVHCRAGLGRAGTMISSYLIRKYKLDSKEAIAFVRMMRPGSVLGKQPRFLESIQYYLRGEIPKGPTLRFVECTLGPERMKEIGMKPISLSTLSNSIPFSPKTEIYREPHLNEDEEECNSNMFE